MDELPPLAFDHADIVHYARERLASKMSYSTAVYGLLPSEFTLSQVQSAYEAVRGQPMDKRNFRKKLSKSWRDPRDGGLVAGGRTQARQIVCIQ